MLRERSGSALTYALAVAVERHGIVIQGLEGYENPERDEHIWFVRFSCNPRTSGRHTTIWTEIYEAVVRFPVPMSNGVNLTSEFYRRAEKRLALFAELIRD